MLGPDLPASLAASLTIRALRVEDLDHLFDAKSRPAGEKWLERQAGSEVYIAVAEVNGFPVGRVGLDFVLDAVEGVAYLWSAHVEQDFQSQGIGASLFLHLEQVARERGFRAIQLKVGQENLRAQRLYSRLGYEVCGEDIDRWSYWEGDRVEVVELCWVMRKIIPVSSQADCTRTG